jgi:hypothetical protein
VCHSAWPIAASQRLAGEVRSIKLVVFALCQNLFGNELVPKRQHFVIGAVSHESLSDRALLRLELWKAEEHVRDVAPIGERFGFSPSANARDHLTGDNLRRCYDQNAIDAIRGRQNTDRPDIRQVSILWLEKLVNAKTNPATDNSNPHGNSKLVAKELA